MSVTTSRPALWPLWVVAGAGAVLAGDGLLARRAHQREIASPAQIPAPATELGKAPCPSNTLPDHGVCIPAPPREEAETDSADLALQLLPGRPSDYARYLTPIPGHAAASTNDSTIVPAPAGAEIRALRLESQIGPTRWAALQGVEALLVTLHRVQRGTSLRSYVLVYRGVDFQGPSTWADIADGGVIARVAAAPGPPALRLDVRQLRRGAANEPILSDRLLRDSLSLECDPRNVLPLAAG